MNNGKLTKFRFNLAWDGPHRSRPCWSVHVSGQVYSGSADSRPRCASTSILEPGGGLLSGSNPPRRGRIYRLDPGASRFQRMPTGSERFWYHQACLGYAPVPGSTKKMPRAVLVRLVGRTTNTNLMQPCYLKRVSSQVCSSSAASRSRWALTGILGPQGAVS